jgi:threonylcarbamoyladenosine tRNA methylthiotransferase MtaB
MDFYLTTFGCKVNQYESRVIHEAWQAMGHAPASEASQAGIILVHTCAVTGKAVADLRKAVAVLHRQAPRTPIIVTGCAAQTFAPMLRNLPGVTQVVGLDQRGALLQGPRAFLQTAPKPVAHSPAMLAGISDFTHPDKPRARAQVKVQDGCSHRCTYCIVPLARGESRSREPRAVLEEIQRLLAAGFREISLIGINLRLYGRDLHPVLDFWDLLGMLESQLASQWAGRARLRLSSLDPAMLGPKALDCLAESSAGRGLVCPHLHLSLQSASPRVLRNMGRGHYAPDTILEFCLALRNSLPCYALGLDLLTGFPGEEAADFDQTLVFCRDLPLTYAHVFPFSPRPGTPAADRPDQIPHHLRQNRAKTLRNLARSKNQAFLTELTNLENLTMVVENDDPVQGKCEYYVSCRLVDHSPSHRPKSLLRVKPLAVKDGLLHCATH